ncbi:E3 ubiquitin-protein ligase TRIM37-like [Culex pipiens pallens]|uniref:E3 ubiquitin-protein ligase TRIM37-like n=1 Tax=Culex pipiens pallens TaxID=42434 RepID=UPI0019549597|nr:E3 ubiquitin-protein ligase TRIM37-like [Culex pipiens pallens]
MASELSQQQQQEQLLKELSESLECQICLKTTDDPHLCPKCSKFYCFVCIRDWLQKSGKDACPNCLGSVCLAEFVKFRWGNGIESLRNLVAKPEVTGSTSKSLGIALKRTQEAFDGVTERIQQTLAKRKEALKASKDGLIKSINILVQQEFREVHKQYNDKLAEVDAWNDILTKELNKSEVNLYALKDSVSKEPSTETERQQLESQCQVLTKKLQLLAPNVAEHRFYCKLMPAPSSWRFTVRNFSQARTENKIQYSDLVRDDLGNTWRLEIHPNGFGDAKNTSVSVFLQLYEGIEGRYHYVIELPNRLHPYHTYEDEDIFELRKGWGQNHFVDQKLLFDRYLENDSFELRFSVRSPHLIDKYDCLRKYADKLERNNSALREECSVDCVNEACCIRNVAEVSNAFGCLYSDSIRDDLGGSWRLQVYPGGNGEMKGLFVGVFLEMVDGIPNSYEFTVTLVGEGFKSVKKSLEHNFQPWMPFGWKNFISRGEFLEGGYIKKDALMVKLAIRPPTVGHKFNYLRQYHDKAIRDIVQAQSKPASSSSLLNSKPFEAPLSFFKKILPRTPSQDQPGCSTPPK